VLPVPSSCIPIRYRLARELIHCFIYSKKMDSSSSRIASSQDDELNHDSNQTEEHRRETSVIGNSTQPLPSKDGTSRSRHSTRELLRPFRLLTSDFKNVLQRWPTDWTFNQLIFASAVYVFFTNLLPWITFASDLYVLTGKNYGAIEVVMSTAFCGIVFSL
jgi:hypothetical protein